MKSRTTRRFRELLERLPADIQGQAKAAFAEWQENPDHPSLDFKPVGHSSPRAYSVRVSLRYRAIGLSYADEIRWVWIGSHADYDHELSRYR